MVKFYVLDADNRPVTVDSLREWGEWLESSSNMVVGYTQINSEIFVSTVFLGIDHRLTRPKDGPPILFETMIFGGKFAGYQWRYASWDDAETGHVAAVRRAREAAGQRVTAEGER